MTEHANHRLPLLCRWFKHKPGEVTWPFGTCWCRRCGIKCDRWGAEW